MMTKDELRKWMGCQTSSSYDGIKIVVDCPSYEIAQEVADCINNIIRGPYFDCHDEYDKWWRYLFLYCIIMAFLFHFLGRYR